MLLKRTLQILTFDGSSGTEVERPLVVSLKVEVYGCAAHIRLLVHLTTYIDLICTTSP